jgi:Sugar-tranasporters, 12 TM
MPCHAMQSTYCTSLRQIAIANTTARSPNNRALDVLLIMTGLLALTLALSTLFTPEDQEAAVGTDAKAVKAHKELHTEFDAFRRKYIVVYLIIMLADWMQGTHMYTLYASYNVNISALFLTGFLSGAIFAPFLGSAVDKFGRKRSCIVYLVLEITINCMEHSTDMTVLLMGRVLGGISTNLLFSAFESWMTTEHRHRGFPEEWLTRTYAEVSPCLLLVSVFLWYGIRSSHIIQIRLQLEMERWPFWPESLHKSWRITWDTLGPSRERSL